MAKGWIANIVEKACGLYNIGDRKRAIFVNSLEFFGIIIKFLYETRR